MVLNEPFDGLFNLRWRGIGDLTAKGGHQFIVFRSFYFQHLQVRGVTVDLRCFPWLGEDRCLGEVRKDERQGDRSLARHLEGESSSLHFDGVDTFYARLVAVDVKLTLVHLHQTSFNLEMLAVFAAGGKEKHDREKI